MDPLGPSPQESDRDQGPVLLIALVVSSVFAVSLVGTKIWARTRIAENLGWDDVFVVLGAVSLRTQSAGQLSFICLGVRYCGDSTICQSAPRRPGETRPVPQTRASRSGWTLVIYCSVPCDGLDSFRSTLGCMLVDAELWHH